VLKKIKKGALLEEGMMNEMHSSAIAAVLFDVVKCCDRSMKLQL